MPRKPDIPPQVSKILDDLRLRLRLSPNSPAEIKIQWYKEVCEQVGSRAANIAMFMLESGLPTNQVNQYFTGENKVDAVNNPGGQSNKLEAGGDMIGVNVGGTQTIRDITIYKQDLDQTGSAITPLVKQALIEAREAVAKSQIDEAVKVLITENFDKLTNELKKGEAKNTGLVGSLWTMIYKVVESIPTAVEAFDKLRVLLGY